MGYPMGLVLCTAIICGTLLLMYFFKGDGGKRP